jgi:hypothetical protein
MDRPGSVAGSGIPARTGEWGRPPPVDSVPAADAGECLVRLSGHRPTRGTVLVTHRPKRERILRALLLLLVWPWACLLAAFIPPHGEPLFVAFFGGIYLIYRALTTAFIVRHLEAVCPRCGSTLKLRPDARLKQSLEIPCYTCHFHPWLDLAPPAA